MALAIRFDRLLQDGVVANQSELARLAHVTQPRMTQIMNLLNLAPDIQEEVLHLPEATQGRDILTERDLRPIMATIDWRVQRGEWRSLSAQASTAGGSR
jgi:DNA-binding transcriptional regulator YdaS (Cro superfamily)